MKSSIFNKFILLFVFLIIGLMFWNEFGFAEIIATPYNPYICEYFAPQGVNTTLKLESVLTDLNIPTNLNCESKSTLQECNNTKGCNMKSNGQCKPLYYCNIIDDCPTSKIVSKDLSNAFISFGAELCSGQECVITDYIKCYPRTTAVSFIKKNVVINNDVEASAFTNLTGIPNVNIINFCESVFPGVPFGDMMSDLFCDIKNYGDRKNHPDYDLTNYWGKYFLIGALSSATNIGGDITYNDIYSGNEDLWPRLLDNNIYSCSPNMNHESLTDASQITLLISDLWESLILNTNNNIYVNYKVSSCNNYVFSCPCTPNGKECYLQGCNSNTFWLCNPKKPVGSVCSTGTCDASGNCVSTQCSIPTKPCPLPSNPCMAVDSCTNGMCKYKNKDLGASCSSWLTCDGFGSCDVPKGGISGIESFCKFDTSKSDDNHIVCNIAKDGLDFNIDALDLDAMKSKHKIEINYNGTYTFTLTNKKYSDLNYYLYSSKGGTLKIDTNILFEQQNFFGGFTDGGNLNLVSGGKFKQMSFTNAITVSGLRSILDKLIVNNDANVWIQGMTGGSTFQNLDIFGGILKLSSNSNTIVTNLNLSYGQLQLYSYSSYTNRNLILLKNSSILNSNIDAQKLELNNVTLDLINSTITNSNSPVTLYANGSKASFRFIDYSGISKTQKYILDSVGNKDKNYVIFIDSLSNGGKFSFDISPVKKYQNGNFLSEDFFVKVNTGKSTTATLDLNFNSLNVSVYNSFYNLASISDSNNVNIFGPEYMYINYIPNSNFFKIETNVSNMIIRNLKYYSPNTSLQNGYPIYSKSPLTIYNSIINNAEVAVTFNNSAGFSSDSKIYSNSFSNNRVIFGSVGTNNVYFFNNFLKDNSCILNDNFSGNDSFCNHPVPTKLKWFGFISDVNNSFGSNSNCNNNISVDGISNMFKDYNEIPIFYYDLLGNKTNDIYTPICYGGNLYYEKQKLFGCTSNCFVDGSDVDFVAETAYPTIDGYDHGPLVYSIFNMVLSNINNQYDLAIDENVKGSLRFWNYSKTNYNAKLTYFIMQDNKIIFSTSPSYTVVPVGVAPEGVAVSILYKLSNLNITDVDTYTLKIEDKQSGIIVKMDFNVIDSSKLNIDTNNSITVKTVKTPDNSIYVILLLVATTIGFVIFKSRN